jgi:hypothetical protein
LDGGGGGRGLILGERQAQGYAGKNGFFGLLWIGPKYCRPKRRILQAFLLAHPKAFIVLAWAQKGKVSDHNIMNFTAIDNCTHHLVSTVTL